MATPKQALGVAAVVVGSAVAVSGAALGGCLASPPASIATNCSSDVAPQLTSEVNSLPPNSTVNLTAGACYLINSTLSVQGRSGLTINGNGATLKRTTSSTVPLVQLFQNTNLTISGVKIQGAYNGTNGGAGTEGNYGLLMEANAGVSITGMTMTNVQGDFINLNAPVDITSGNTQALNTGVSITDSTFTGAGYHGLTLEGINGLTVRHDTFADINVDAIDAEYDTFSSAFSASGQVQYAAQDNILIADDTFSNFGNDFYASIQGQQPGVQQQNVNLSYNTIDGGSGLFEIVGTNTTDARYQNVGLIVFDNQSTHANVGTTGSSCGGTPGSVAAMQMQYVTNATIAANTLPIFACAGAQMPYISVLQAYSMANLVVQMNTFNGAYSMLQPGSGNNTGVPCENHFGVNASQSDGPCPSP